MTEEKQKDSGRTKRVRLSAELTVLAQRICPKCNLPVIPGLEKCPRDGTSLEQADSGPHAPITQPQQEFLTMSDRYDHLGSLGSGGMSVVYKARDRVLDRIVAIKQLSKELVSEQMVLRFQREACAYAALKHPNIVNVFDFGFDEENRPFLVMDFLEGRTLDEVISAKGQVPISETLPIFIQLLDGLSHAHAKGIIHRDLKPANVMIQRFDEQLQVKILDFGIAKSTTHDSSSSWHTQTGTVMGSPLYMSPEQSVSPNVDARADIYSVGCMLFETLTGQPPFRGQTLMETISKHRTEAPPKIAELVLGADAPIKENSATPSALSLDMEAIVLAALQKNPDDRYQTASDMRADLLCLQENWNKTQATDGTRSSGISRTDVVKIAMSSAVAIVILYVCGICAGSLTVQKTPDSKRAQKQTSPVAEKPAADSKLFESKEYDYWLDAHGGYHALHPDVELTSLPPNDVLVLNVGRTNRSNADASVATEASVAYQKRLEGLTNLQSLEKLTILNLQVTPKLLGAIASIKSLQSVGIYDTKIPRSTVEVISKLPNLRSVELKGCDLIPEDLRPLARVRNLERLMLDQSPIGGRFSQTGIEKLRNLKTLGLAHVHVTDADTSCISALSRLEVLMLEESRITAVGCAMLAKLQNLRFLSINYCPTVNDDAVKELSAVRVKTLELTCDRAVTNKSAPYLAKIKDLTKLDLTGCSVTEAGMVTLSELRPDLSVKNTGAVEQLTEVLQP